MGKVIYAAAHGDPALRGLMLFQDTVKGMSVLYVYNTSLFCTLLLHLS